MKRAAIFVGLAAAVFGGGVLAGRASRSTAPGAAGEEKKDADELKPRVKIAHVTRSTVSRRIVCFGTARLAPGSDVILAARVAAVVSEVVHRVGDAVAAGDVLVRLDARSLAAARVKADAALVEATSELQKGRRGALAIELSQLRVALAQAKADSLQAERALARQKELATAQLVSERQLQEAQAAAEVAQLRMSAAAQQLERAESGLQAEELARLEARVAAARADADAARLQESFADVRAPIGGVLSELDAAPGQSVDATTVLGRIVAPGTVEALLAVPAELAGEVARGASVRLLAGGVEVAQATITGVGASAAADDLVKLRATVADPRTVKGVLPGTPLEAEVAVGSLEALAVPSAAVIQDGERTVVVTLVATQQKNERGEDEAVKKSLKVPVKVVCRDGPLVGIEPAGKDAELVDVDAAVVVEGGYNLPDSTEVEDED